MSTPCLSVLCGSSTKRKESLDHQMLKTIKITLIFAIVANFALSVPAGRKTDAELLYVVDGDTIKVRIDDKVEDVRLLGVDTPECKNNAKARKDAEKSGEDIYKIIRDGQLAFCHTVLALKDTDTVKLEFEKKTRGKYGRLLAYVWYDGKLLNLELVENGLAIPLFYGKSRYKSKIERAYRKAKRKKSLKSN